MIIRVFLMPKDIIYQDSVNYTFREIDSFPYSTENYNNFYNDLSEFIKKKSYYKLDRSYLIISEMHSFTLNYKLPNKGEDDGY